jgi:excinuclease ABC subunit C
MTDESLLLSEDEPAPEKTGSYRPDQIGEIPRAPGVYQMFDAKGKIIYIGKAINLRNRVRQYFAPPGSGDDRPSVPLIRKALDHIEVIVTLTEKEAFLLENTLIKRHMPRYNILLRDDKMYVSVRIDPREPWPRPLVTRPRGTRDKALYFGPYTQADAIRNALNLTRKIFPLRSCSDPVFRNRTRPCIQYEIGNCKAPCVGKITREEYMILVQGLVDFLKGRAPQVLENLKRQMAEHSASLEFEKAAAVRDQIRAIEASAQAQRVSTHESGSRDVVGWCEEKGQAAIAILFFRDGQLIESLNWTLSVWGETPALTLSQFLGQFYGASRLTPDELLLPLPVDDESIITEWLSEMHGKRVEVLTPQRGEKLRLVEMATANAREALQRKLSGKKILDDALEDLAYRLRLAAPPHTLECYDIATLQGTDSAGSKVVFRDGEPDKAMYRLFKIKTVEGQNDFAMMQEVLTRRFRRAIEEKEELPSLVIVDGGRGQLNIAYEVLESLGLSDLPLAGLVKEHLKEGETKDESVRTPEYLLLPGRKNPVVFPPRAPSFYLLQRLRDEAHRFVNTFHKKLRTKSRFRSPLEDVPGIGPAKAKALLRHFGSQTRLKAASQDDLKNAPGMNASLAETLFAALHENTPSD